MKKVVKIAGFRKNITGMIKGMYTSAGLTVLCLFMMGFNWLVRFRGLNHLSGVEAMSLACQWRSMLTRRTVKA